MNDAPVTLLNWVDYTIIAIIGLSTLISLIRGFVREALSLGVWILSFVIAFKFSSTLAPSLQSYISSEGFRFAAAFSLLMLASLLVGALITHLLSLVVNKSGLSATDRLLGILFGFLRGIFLVVILIMIGEFSNLQRQYWWSQSQMIPQFQGLVLQVKELLPDELSQFPAFLESQKNKLQKKAKGVTESLPIQDESGRASQVIEDAKKAIQGQTGGGFGLPAILNAVTPH